MAYYRLYTIGRDGRFRDVAAVEVGTDAEACDIAMTYLHDHPAIEVWQQARRVALVTHDGTQMAS